MDIYQVLKNDHDELKVLVDELVNLKEDDDYRFILIDQISDLLIPHSRAEESVFYNSLRAVNADKKITFHGFQEHLEVEGQLRQLQIKDKLSLDWKATAEKLRNSLLHHIEDEETEIFAEARAAFTKQESDAMGDAFVQLKAKVQKEGFIKHTADMIINMMPPRLIDKIKNLGEPRT